MSSRCVWHPEEETLLSCGLCERPICTECAHHTPVGTKCWECAGEPPPLGVSSFANAEDSQTRPPEFSPSPSGLDLQAPGPWHWVGALAAGVFSFLVPPLILIGIWQAWRKKLTGRVQLTIAVVAWMGVWALSQLLIELPARPGELFPQYSVGGSAVLLAASLILVPLMLAPAISVAHQLRQREGLWASLPVFSGCCAALMLSLAFALTVFIAAL